MVNLSQQLTDVITVCPSLCATNSFTWPDRAAFKWLPPMKWAPRLYFAEYDLACPLVILLGVPLVRGTPFEIEGAMTARVLLKVEQNLDECQYEMGGKIFWDGK